MTLFQSWVILKPIVSRKANQYLLHLLLISST